jgi:hypothetical protein
VIVEVPPAHVRSEIEAGRWPRFIESTGCWRGYIAIWEIKDGRLFLNEVAGRYKLARDEPLFAGWFTGVLRVALGGTLRPIHMGFASVPERELHIKVEKGIVFGQREIDNKSRPIDPHKLAIQNLPGGENRFEGDDY